MHAALWQQALLLFAVLSFQCSRSVPFSMVGAPVLASKPGGQGRPLLMMKEPVWSHGRAWSLGTLTLGAELSLARAVLLEHNITRDGSRSNISGVMKRPLAWLRRNDAFCMRLYL